MPQGRKSFEELLRQPAPSPTPTPARPSFEQLLQQSTPTPGPSFEQLLQQPPQQPPQDESYYQWLKRNVGIETQAFLRKVGDVTTTGFEIGREALHGNFQPLKETVELTGRGLAPIVSALGNQFNPGGAYVASSIQQAGPIADVNARRQARREAGPDVEYWRRSRADIGRLEAERQADPALSSKIVRGVAGAAPYVGLGVLSGGSVPMSAGLSAALELNTPENLGMAAILGSIPGGGAKAASGAVERVLGKGAAQIVEAEAASAPRQAAQMALFDAQAVAKQEAAQMSLPGMEAVIQQEVAKVSPGILKRAVGELSSFPRAMMSSLDISAPGRQGLLLSVAPSRWGAAIKAGKEMFQAFKPEAYERITKAIANDAYTPLAEKSGLYLAFRGAAEELFTSKLASKVPGVTASQRMYEVYLDSLRMSTWKRYVKLIEKTPLTPEQTTKALEAAARWINVASGRGSIGKKFDDAVPFLSQFLFAPRFTVSRFSVLNPVMYAKNYANPATRVVAKQQMKDLASYVTAVATTFGLAKAAGFDVGLNPASGDFLKIRSGNKTFDVGGGLTQVMRFAIRASMDLFGAAKGEKAGYGQDAASLTERFIRSKLAPIPSYAWDFLSRRTYTGQEFTSGKARAVGVLERAVPLTWSDFTEALWNEGLGSAAGTLPGAIGIGVQNYAKPGGILERAQPLFSEYQRLGRGIPEIHRLKTEDQAGFNTRLKVHGEALERYGMDLVNSDEFKRADDATKRKALDLLPRRISTALLKQGEAWQLSPRVIMSDVRESQQLRGR